MVLPEEVESICNYFFIKIIISGVSLVEGGVPGNHDEEDDPSGKEVYAFSSIGFPQNDFGGHVSEGP